jgi:hypothetical protein
MTTLIVLLGAALAGLGAWLFYLAWPQQRWRSAGPWPSRWRWRWLPGTMALALAQAILLGALAATAAIPALLCVAMLVWTAAPFLAAWRRHGRTPTR